MLILQSWFQKKFFLSQIAENKFDCSALRLFDKIKVPDTDQSVKSTITGPEADI